MGDNLTGFLLFGLGLLSLNFHQNQKASKRQLQSQILHLSESGKSDTTSISAASERWSLKGKNIVVTGGTLGIGKAIVEECARLGATVLTCGRKSENLIACFQEWQKAGLKNIHGCIADVSTSEGRNAFISSIERTFPNKIIHVLVNNVGTNIRKRAIEYTDEEYHQIMQTNLNSAFFLTKQVYPYLQKNDNEGSSVINVGSVAGKYVFPIFPPPPSLMILLLGGCNTAIRSGIVYAMTKAAMAQMTYNLACEWAKENIRVNTIAPWYTETPLTKPFLANPDIINLVLQRTPMARIAQADEVSGIVAFLSMNHASYITGQVIAVDGGFLRYGFY